MVGQCPSSLHQVVEQAVVVLLGSEMQDSGYHMIGFQEKNHKSLKTRKCKVSIL